MLPDACAQGNSSKTSRVPQSIAPTQALSPIQKKPNPVASDQIRFTNAIFCLWSSNRRVLCKTGTSFSGSSLVPEVWRVTRDLTNKPLHAGCSSLLLLLSPCFTWRSVCVGSGCRVEMSVKLNEHIYISVSTTVGFRSCQYNSQVTWNNGTTSLRGK